LQKGGGILGEISLFVLLLKYLRTGPTGSQYPGGCAFDNLTQNAGEILNFIESNVKPDNETTSAVGGVSQLAEIQAELAEKLNNMLNKFKI
jgi:hypothetical protein